MSTYLHIINLNIFYHYIFTCLFSCCRLDSKIIFREPSTYNKLLNGILDATMTATNASPNCISALYEFFESTAKCEEALIDTTLGMWSQNRQIWGLNKKISNLVKKLMEEDTEPVVGYKCITVSEVFNFFKCQAVNGNLQAMVQLYRLTQAK